MTANGRGWKTWGRAAFLAALAAAGLWLAAGPESPGRAAPAPAADADAVPADGMAVFTAHFSELWNSSAFKGVREQLAKNPEFAGQMAKGMGVGPDDVERLTMVIPTVAGPPEGALVVTTVKPYDAEKVAAVVPDGKEETVNGHKMRAAEGGAVGFLSDRTFVVGRANQVRQVLERAGAGKEGPLAAAVREAAGKHCIVAGLDVEALAKAAPPELPPDAAPFKPLLKAKTAVLTVDLGDEVTANLRVTFDGESDAKQGEDAVNAALDMARAGMVKGIEQVQQQKELADFVGLLKDAQAALRAAKVERSGSAVEVSASMKADVAKTVATLLPAVQKVREAAARMQSINNLKQMALAMYNYNDVNGHFPAQAVYDKNGKPLLSWRVMILPYIEQNQLYNEFHLDEPWDSEHNKKLLEKMPKTLASPSQSAESLKKFETPYQGFAGKGAFFDGKDGIKITDITDGTSNTIMLVDTAKTVPWTKPDDIPFDAGKLVPKVGGLSPGIFLAAFCDGPVRVLPMTIKEDTLRALITINGGEVIQIP